MTLSSPILYEGGYKCVRMFKHVLLLCLLCIFVLIMTNSSYAVDYDTSLTMTGRVQDASGKPVKGAEIFIYTSEQVRRTADFISPLTDDNGLYSLVLPKGTYWCAARLRKSSERFGPLMPGDKHSGDPKKVELSSDREHVDFTISDLKEASALLKKKKRDDYLTIKGRILDGSGNPLNGAYAIASTTQAISIVPDYLSAWTDHSGQYTLYLPRGKYYLGSSIIFPPERNFALGKEITLIENRDDLDIVTRK